MFGPCMWIVKVEHCMEPPPKRQRGIGSIFIFVPILWMYICGDNNVSRAPPTKDPFLGLGWVYVEKSEQIGVASVR